MAIALMGPQTIDLSKLLAPYVGMWVALSSDEKRVVGSGTSIDIALEQARKSGEERPIIVRSPDKFSSLIL
jgi:hypothetical protein